MVTRISKFTYNMSTLTGQILKDWDTGMNRRVFIYRTIFYYVETIRVYSVTTPCKRVINLSYPFLYGKVMWTIETVAVIILLLNLHYYSISDVD